MKVRILQSAFNDLDAGADFYDECEPGVGGYFIASLLADIDSLAFYGGIHRVIRVYHRALSKRFPHAIYYRMEDGCVVVHAVLDCRRNPRWIARQLKSRSP
ncbi:MAG: type II toxin-antitoxin system RelE/ParE family toxin [Verrucomicrobia bacterium]|nr:type II toxin-antitoxin system RelE/ParE family toxin [Verrucomicrobiota bacterium]